jgi:TPR repeat protein
MYIEGHGVPQDTAEAVKWFRRAAEQGDALAQGELGDM